MTTFTDIVDWCAEQLDACADAIATKGGRRPHVYRWWEAGMAEPSAYLWTEPPQTVETVDSCTVRHDVRMVLCFSVQPRSGTGEEYLTVEAVLDAVLPTLLAALPAYSHTLRRRVVMAPWRIVRDETTGEGAPKPLVVEVPLVIPWFHDVAPAI